MRVENSSFIIDEPIENEAVEELLKILKEQEFDKIVIENSQIDASAIQALFCYSKGKQINTDDPFLKKVFSKVIYIEEV